MSNNCPGKKCHPLFHLPRTFLRLFAGANSPLCVARLVALPCFGSTRSALGWAACFATPVEVPDTVREATWPTSPAAPTPLPEPIEEASAEVQVDGGSWAIGVESIRMLSTVVLSGKMDGA